MQLFLLFLSEMSLNYYYEMHIKGIGEEARGFLQGPWNILGKY